MMKEDKRPLMVSIRCITYNHEPYIRQCLDGFVMQKTDFRFEAIVHDDASTDGTAAIIKEYAEKYPDIIKPIFETENQWSKHDGSLQRLMDKTCKGKYIALCEGDDYWIDPLKLQKQVFFLESHYDYAMCYTKAQTIRNGRVIGCSDESHKLTPSYMITYKKAVRTPTVLYRSDLYERYIREVEPDKKGWLMGDYPLWMYFTIMSKCYWMPDITAAYRIHDGSITHTKDSEKFLAFIKSGTTVRKYFVTKYYESFMKRGGITSLKKLIDETEKRRIIIFYLGQGNYEAAYMIVKEAAKSQKLKLFKTYFWVGFKHLMSLVRKRLIPRYRVY